MSVVAFVGVAALIKGYFKDRNFKNKRYKKFEAKVYILKKDEEGRDMGFFTGYRPQFEFDRTTHQTAEGLIDALKLGPP